MPPPPSHSRKDSEGGWWAVVAGGGVPGGWWPLGHSRGGGGVGWCQGLSPGTPEECPSSSLVLRNLQSRQNTLQNHREFNLIASAGYTQMATYSMCNNYQTPTFSQRGIVQGVVSTNLIQCVWALCMNQNLTLRMQQGKES